MCPSESQSLLHSVSTKNWSEKEGTHLHVEAKEKLPLLAPFAYPFQTPNLITCRPVFLIVWSVLESGMAQGQLYMSPP